MTDTTDTAPAVDPREGWNEADDELFGGSEPGLVFTDGEHCRVRGVITDKTAMQRREHESKGGGPAFWDDGRPKMMTVITFGPCEMSTDQGKTWTKLAAGALTKDPEAVADGDDGIRRFFASGRKESDSPKDALIAAMRKAGRPKGPIQIGATLVVDYFKGVGTPKSPKRYRCEYIAPDPVDAFDDE